MKLRTAALLAAATAIAPCALAAAGAARPFRLDLAGEWECAGTNFTGKARLPGTLADVESVRGLSPSNSIQLKKQGNADWSLDMGRDFGPYYYTRRQIAQFTKRNKSGNRIVSLYDAPGGALDDKVYFYTAVVEIDRDCWVASLPDFNNARYIKCYDIARVIASVSWSYDPNNFRHYSYTGEVDGLFKRKAMLPTLQKLVNNERWSTDLCPHTRVEVTE